MPFVPAVVLREDGIACRNSQEIPLEKFGATPVGLVKRRPWKPRGRIVAVSDFGRHRSRQVLRTRSDGACEKIPAARLHFISSKVLCHICDTNVINSEILQKEEGSL